MSIDAAIGIVWDVLKMGFAPIKRGLGYVMSSKSYADNLRNEVGNLEYEDQRVSSAVEIARSNPQDIHGWVPVFLANAEKALKEAGDLLGEFDEANKTCCGGTLPDPKCRYQFSRKAKHKTDEIKNLILENSNREVSFIGPVAYAADLRKELGNLEYEYERVGNLVTEAGNNMRDLLGVFATWKADAEEALQGARDLLGDFEGASKIGGRGTLPDSCGRDQFSTKAGAHIKVVRELAQQCSDRFKELDDVSIPASTDSMSTNPTDGGVFKSRASVIKEIMDALADDTKSVIGVHGMGGVGKSTLLEDAEKRMGAKKLFDWVAKADVSQNPDIKKIQKDIARCLGLSEFDKEDDVSMRAKFLHARLEKEVTDKKKVLIILDNLWVPLDLKSVGIPCGYDNKAIGCKLLLTARDRDVLQRGMGCDSAIPLGVLKQEEARALFEKIVGDKVHDDEFKPWVEKALRRCAGVPFLIVAMAKLLKNAALYEWKDTLTKIEKSNHREINGLIFEMLQWSYDRLEEEEKSLLRLCVVYSVSNPSLDYLVRYGFGLGIFREVGSLEEARNRLRALIRTLQASSLLLGDDEDADGFKIHDLVREFVASFASTDRPLLVLKDKDKSVTELSEDKLRSCEAICFPYVDLEELPEEIVCPELRIFLLLQNDKSLEISDSYFNSMKNLMVLDLTEIRLTRSPSPFQSLKKLHSLCLDYCSLEDVTVLGELKGLQILSLLNSDIQRLPKEIGQLAELRLLDLDDCSELSIIEPGLLGKLTKLEELYMSRSFDKWDALDQTPPTNASLIELNNMKKLRTLYVSIPDPSVLPKDLDVEKLTEYRIRIGDVWRRSECEGSMTLELKLDPASDILQNECIQNILCKTDDMYLDGLNKTEHSICCLSVEGFPKLKHLQVEDSPSVRHILERSSFPAFKVLESLLLKKLIDLEKICYSDISSSKSFSTLKVIRVESCDKMEVLFPRSVARELPQLEEIEVVCCKLMRGIVEADGDCGKFEFPKLRVLKLRDLPNIENFITNRSATSSSTSDGQVGTQIAFFSGQQVAFPRLESLEITKCQNLRFMFSPSTVRSFTRLGKLSVSWCKKMEAVIMEEEGSGVETSETLTFSMLTDLSLQYLESLTCFFHGSQETQSEDHVKSRSSLLFSQEVALPSLETLYISGMDNIEMIWGNQVAVDSFPRLKSLFVVECNKLLTAVPCFVLGHLLCLESLEAKACGSLEVVFGLQPLIPLDGHPIALQLKELAISGLPKLKRVWDKELHRQVKFQHLRSVSVSECNSLTSLFPASVTTDLIQLEELVIRGCGIVELIEKEGGLPVTRFVFPKLTSLQLSHLTELKCLYTGTHSSHWPALKTLEMDSCNKVEILASSTDNEIPCHKQPLFLLEKAAFPNLQELKLDLSGRVEIRHGNFHDEESICKLRVLELRHLSKEDAMSTCHFVESLTNLEELVVSESYLEEPINNVEAIDGPCQELKVIFPFSRRIQHLKTLDVSRSHGLSSLFTPTIAENLVALTKLRISNCRILTEVISDEEFEEKCEVAFNQLKYIELEGLIQLRCFSSSGYTLVFPLLEDVIVNGCPKMEVFSNGPIKTPKLERVKVGQNERYGTTEYRDFWKGDLNITIQNMYEETFSAAGDQFMRLFEFPKLIEKWHSDLNPLNSSWQLETLLVDKCPNFINVIPSKLMLVLEKMRSLQVCDCESLEEIFDLQGLEVVESTRVLPCLQDLYLTNLPKLRQLWNKDLQGTMRFNSLCSLTLYKCSNLKHAFTPSMARCLANIGWMEIRECNQMEGVIEEEEGQGSAMEKITFPNLWKMKLECLPNLTSFLSGKNHALDCPKISSLTIAHCPKMRSLNWQSSMEIDHSTPSLFTPRVQFVGLGTMVLSHMENLSKIWPDNPLETLTFDSLSSVEVENCESLENVFPHWVAARLTQLEKLQVESCMIEKIVANGDDTSHSNIAQVFFPKLTALVLHDMARLKTLPALNWPFLKELQVTHCDKVNMLSFAASINKWTQRNDPRDLLDQEAHSSFERDFPNLEKLLLVVNDIQVIEDGKFPDDIFGQTEAITLACFHEEKAVFPTKFLLERFQNLKSLEVLCSSFEDIFLDKGIVEEGKHPMLESLRELKLSKLHKLKRVWREDYFVSKVLQSIKTLEVSDCASLTTLFPAVTSFHNLTELVVKNSFGLVHLATGSAIASLVNLTRMTIIGCERMKEVVAKDENDEGRMISFEKLEVLKLRDMPSLECFTSCVLRLPSLDEIEVEECPKMKIFSKGTLSTPKREYGTLFRYKLNEVRCSYWGCSDLNRAIRSSWCEQIRTPPLPPAAGEEEEKLNGSRLSSFVSLLQS